MYNGQTASLVVREQQVYPLGTIAFVSRLVYELVNSFFKIWGKNRKKIKKPFKNFREAIFKHVTWYIFICLK